MKKYFNLFCVVWYFFCVKNVWSKIQNKIPGYIWDIFPARPPIVSLCDAKNVILLATQGDEKFVEGVG